MTQPPRRLKTKIWVVSLRTAEARRKAFLATVTDAAQDWALYGACSGVADGLVYDAKRVRALNNRPLQNGELGCYSSHYQLWDWLEHNPDYEQMVVLEDDVAIDWGFVSELSKVDLQSRGIEYLRLFAKMPSTWRFVASPFFDKYRHLIQFTGYPLGTQAYVLTREGARKFRRHAQVIEAAVDVYMDRTWVHKVLNLALVPFPAYERHQPSSIGEERFKYTARRPEDVVLSFLPKLRRRLNSLWLAHGVGDAEARRLRRRLNEAAK